MAQPFAIAYRTLVPGDFPRPYLVMALTGVDGHVFHLLGLVDSGADTTSLPFGYATLLGYTTSTLSQQSYAQVGGTGTAHRALQPCQARVPEIPDVVIDVHPLFVPGAQVVLWGRRDFMTKFDVAISETNQRFSITPV